MKNVGINISNEHSNLEAIVGYLRLPGRNNENMANHLAKFLEDEFLKISPFRLMGYTEAIDSLQEDLSILLEEMTDIETEFTGGTNSVETITNALLKVVEDDFTNDFLLSYLDKDEITEQYLIDIGLDNLTYFQEEKYIYLILVSGLWQKTTKEMFESTTLPKAKIEKDLHSCEVLGSNYSEDIMVDFGYEVC